MSSAERPRRATRQAILATLPSLAFVAAFSLIANLLLLTVPLYMMQIFDRVVVSRSVDTLIYLTVVALGALFTVGFLDGVRSRALLRIGVWLERRLAPETFARVLEASLGSESYRTEALRDLTQIRGFVAGQAIVTLFDAPWAPVFIFVTYLLHPLLGSIAIGAALLLFTLAILNDVLTRRPLREASVIAMQAGSRALAASRNAEAIDAMGMLPGVMSRWLIQAQDALHYQIAAAKRSGHVVAASKFCRLAVQIVLIAAGAWLVLQQEITGGAMIAASIIMSRALAPVEQAIGVWKQATQAGLAYRRLAHFLDGGSRPADGMALPAPIGRLTVEGVSWTPPGQDRLVIRNVSFALEPGECLAILGPSAAGKSTLARLIVGNRKPTAGHVRLDGADVYDWPRAEFGSHVGYLPQDVELLPGSIAENIARMGDADPDAVVAAAGLADVHEMILRLGKGYDTVIGDVDTVLSGGQRQRVALARALYGSPKLIVLDEPNANLDNEGEQALLRALAALKGAGATVVLITHRPNLLNQVDTILVLRHGAIEIFGPRLEILKRLRPQPVSGPRPVGTTQLPGQA